MSIFLKHEKCGNLTVDKVLFETYIPILFICKNEYNQLFACVCCQDNVHGRKYLIARTSAENIIQMLTNKITVRDLLLSDPSIRISMTILGANKIIEENGSEWNEGSLFLPKGDSFIDADPGEYDEEIKYYRLKIIQYGSDQYVSIAINNNLSMDSFDTSIISKNSITITEENIDFILEITGIKHRTSDLHSILFSDTYKSLLKWESGKESLQTDTRFSADRKIDAA